MRRVLSILLLIVSIQPAAFAQGPSEPSNPPQAGSSDSWLQKLDTSVLTATYRAGSSGIRTFVSVVDETSYPILYSAPFIAWGSLAITQDPSHLRSAYNLTISEGVAYLVQRGVKEVFRRPRPFYTLAEVPSRSIRYPDPADVFSFPSGHATASFAIASSISLSFPEWYVMAPVMLWAGSVSFSRVWLGVHYPSDVFVGMVLGLAIGYTVHGLQDHLTPSFLREYGSDRPVAATVRFTF